MPKKKIFHDSDSEVDEVEEEAAVESEDGQDDLAEDSADSDAAPDDVAFSHSKADALRKVKDALTTIGKEKERQRTKRRQKDDQYKDQKKQKLEALSKSRLPDDFLESISSAPVRSEPRNETEAEKKTTDQTGAPSEDHEEGSEGGASDTDDDDDDSFLPLGDSHVKAVYVRDQSRTATSAVQTASAFRTARLYGGKIKRCTEKTRTSLSAKRRARYR